MSYYRRAGMSADADRVFALANAHPEAAVRWQRKSQTPRVFHPDVYAQPWWDPEMFKINHELRAAYQKDGGRELQRQLDSMIMLKDGAVRGSLDADVNDGLQRIYTPYIGVRSTDSSAERGAGAWAEFGPLFDGVNWNEAKCATVPLICDTLKNHSAGELCGGYSALSAAQKAINAEDIELECGADTVVTILRLRPGAHILPHCGTTNKRLIMHFALRGEIIRKILKRNMRSFSLILGAEGVWFRVGDEGKGSDWVKSYGNGDGNAIVFDDSFEHEVKHTGERDRYVLLIVLRHPSLSQR